VIFGTFDLEGRETKEDTGDLVDLCDRVLACVNL